jgi:aryl-alcohol dehydrogenase-like predicted oxidoreductase
VKIALGTAQFGLGYGVANARGQVPLEEAAAIMSEARAAGCDTLDTAIAYGDSERRLGQIGVEGWQVVTKLTAVPDDEPDVAGWMRTAVEGSLERLRAGRLYGLLLHRPEQLLTARGEALADALRRVRDAGLVQKVGVSAGSPVDLDALSSRCDLDLVQVPFNLFDRRLTEGGRLDRLIGAGTEVHARSVFLQGLLLMQEGRRPPAFDRWAGVWRTLAEWLREHGVTALQACLRDALAQTGISRAVVGVDSLAQWRDIAASSDGPPLPRPETFDIVDSDVINPLTWLTYPPELMRGRV